MISDDVKDQMIVTDYQYLAHVLLFGVMKNGYKYIGKILRKMELKL